MSSQANRSNHQHISEPQQIYLDYAATTPVHPEVLDKMVQCLSFSGTFGNPASRSHSYGWHAEELVEHAREQVAELIHADKKEIIWTSGATESNNLALKGIAQFYSGKGKHIITSQIEHKAILDTCAELEQQGFEVSYLQPEKQTGLITPEMVQHVIRPDTILVSLMLVNNEIGTLTNIEEISEITRNNGTLLHVDAAQGAGKVSINVEKTAIDLMSLSAHKIYGPKGIGALYVRRSPRVRLKAQIHGGGHERGMRSGTLATHQIVGMGEACRLAKTQRIQEQQRISILRGKLFTGLQDLTPIILNGHETQHVANYLNVSFADTQKADLIINTIKKFAAVSSGSACNSHQSSPSHVLTALGVAPYLAENAVRFSFGAYTTEQDIETILTALKAVLQPNTRNTQQPLVQLI